MKNAFLLFLASGISTSEMFAEAATKDTLRANHINVREDAYKNTRVLVERISIGEKLTDSSEFEFEELREIKPVIAEITESSISFQNEIQEHYTFVTEARNTEDMKGNYWLANDFMGNVCRVYYYLDEPDRLCIGVEYKDMAWIYVVKKITEEKRSFLKKIFTPLHDKSSSR